jgi:type IX secretion system PorP/SprF family membrane protein
MKKFLIFIVFAGSLVSLKAQQDPMYTHYMYNTLGINPAYAGSRDALTVTLLHRSQWVDFGGAPTTQTVTMHAPVFNDMFSLGASIVNDVIGPVRNTGLFVDYAYRFQLTEYSKLAFGLKVGFNNLQANLMGIRLADATPDPAFASDIDGRISPNVGFGVYYSKDKFYMGLSTPKLFSTNYTGSTNSTFYKEQMHYFFIAGSSYSISEAYEFIPTTFVKITKSAPVEADFTATFLYENKFSMGAMYRTNDALGLLAGISLNEQLYMGYSFDWSFVNSTSKYNKGSHELVLRYDFIFTHKGRIRSPRYF